VKDRGVNAEGKANVSREELEDFKRKYGQDKTLRDLLNADRTGKPPASEKSPMARGPQGANVAPRRAEIPTGGGAKAPADTGMGGMSDTTRNVLNTLGALGVGGGAAGLGARALLRREAAKRAAEAEKMASRVEPPMRRLRPEDVTDDLVRSVVDRAYEKTYGAGFKKGGKVKTYAKGGSVRGAGCETRTKKTRFV
jgi:hypothetical protein